MAPAAIAMAGLFISAAGAVQQYKAGKDAKKIASQNAADSRQATEELKRKTAKEQKYTESLARARAAASGVGGGTTDVYMAALEESGREELDWMSIVGASEANAAQAAGVGAQNQAMSGFWGSMGNVAKYGGQAYQSYQDTTAPTTN